MSIGLTPSKSHTIEEVKVPKEYFSDFLRGVFDGDGTFYSYYDKRWKNSLVYQIAFYSASLVFITWIKEKLTKLYKVKGFIRKGDGVWALRYVKGDTRTLYKIMYDKSEVLFLKRKYDKVTSVLRSEIMPR